MAMPGVLTVGLNDDEAERRKRRLKTNIGSIMSPGCHTPNKFGQSASSIRYDHRYDVIPIYLGLIPTLSCLV